jgi:4-amino-4-deoxy-L-arabinose transferase-like glycosyltransferase
MKNVKSIIIVSLIFLWGILLRIIEVINGNYLFGFDQGRDYLAAYNIVVNHKLTLIGAEVGAGAAGLSGLFHGPGYFYLIALMMVLFRGDPYGSILLMFVFGVGTLIVTYVTTRKIFGNEVGMVSLFFVGISPLIVSQSRFLWNHHPSSFFIALSMYFVYMIARKPKIYAPLAIFTAGIIYHFELAIAVPLVISIFIALPLIYRIKDVKIYIYSMGAALFAFVPFLFFEARHNFMAFRSLSSYVNGSATVNTTALMLRFQDHIGSYIHNAKNSFPVDFGLLPPDLFKVFAIILFVALCYFSWKAKEILVRNFFRFLLVMLITSYAMFLLLNNSIWDYYLIHAHFAYIYVCSYCLVLAFKNFKKSVIPKITIVVFCFFLISSLDATARWMIGNFRYDMTELGGVEKIRGKRMAIDYVYQDAKGKPFSVFVFMPPIYTYPYDYLFKTYGKDTYGYAPGNQKKGLVYLIIEKDNSKPWTYNGWLETVIKDGDIIETKTLITGHIIQKRMFPL